MPTKAIIAGFVEKKGGNYRDIVFNKHCDSLKEIQEAVEEAFDRDATIVVIKRIIPMRAHGNPDA